MTVTLPYDSQEWPTLRLLTAPQWGAEWIEQPLAAPGRAGFEILRLSRRALPDIGSATMRYLYGEIDGRYYGFDADQGFIITPNLLHHEIRIQQKLADDSWVTIWWGHCLARQDTPYPGASIGAGIFTYHCVEAIERTARWILDRHQVYWNGVSFPGTDADEGTKGHPGYNAITAGSSILGDKDDTDADPVGLGYIAHAFPGTATSEPWTDQEAVVHALASARRYGNSPSFALNGSTDLLSGYNSWPIDDGENLLNFLRRVFDRRRGRGVAFTDWTESSATGPLTPRITIRPQTALDISETLPSGAAFIVEGANEAGTAVVVDLEGDHRLGEDAGRYELVTEAATDYTGVITEGERIIVAATITEAAGLEQRWTAAEETAWDGATAAERLANPSKFGRVFRHWGLPRDWSFAAEAASGTGRIDYRCDSAGVIVNPAGSGVVERDTSPLMLEYADHLPFLEGYDYSVTPPDRYSGTQDTLPGQISPQMWRKVAGGYYVDAAQDAGLQLETVGTEMFLLSPDDADGARYWETYDTADLALTLPFILPHRVSLSLIQDTRRLKRIRVPGLALHLAHHGAIWSLDETDASGGGYAAQRTAGGATQASPGILRDDRDALARIHYQAVTWYMGTRQTARWSLRAGGMAGTWLDKDGDSNAWPAIGQVVTTIVASGRGEEVYTPITTVEYDHVSGVTSWSTSWSERDFT